jgi:hypothetical protein
MAALTGALRREDNNQKECRRLQRELEALQGLLQERDADLQRLKMVIKLKEGLITRLEVGAPPTTQLHAVLVPFWTLQVVGDQHLARSNAADRTSTWRPQKSVNEAEEFSFASGKKEAIIVELKEEARILRARMENNPEIKRHAGEAPGPQSPPAETPVPHEAPWHLHSAGRLPAVPCLQACHTAT